MMLFFFQLPQFVVLLCMLEQLSMQSSAERKSLKENQFIQPLTLIKN